MTRVWFPAILCLILAQLLMVSAMLPMGKYITILHRFTDCLKRPEIENDFVDFHVDTLAGANGTKIITGHMKVHETIGPVYLKIEVNEVDKNNDKKSMKMDQVTGNTVICNDTYAKQFMECWKGINFDDDCVLHPGESTLMDIPLNAILQKIVPWTIYGKYDVDGYFVADNKKFACFNVVIEFQQDKPAPKFKGFKI